MKSDESSFDVVIVGAGMSGLTARKILNLAGFHVLTLEKSRGVGGRAATKRGETSLFDTGVQGLFLNSQEARQSFSSSLEVTLPNRTKLDRALIHPKGMNSFLKTLIDSSTLDTSPIEFQSKAIRVDYDAERSLFQVLIEDREKVWAKNLILSAPLPQSLDLCKEGTVIQSSSVLESLRSIVYAPCFALYFRIDSAAEWPVFVELDSPKIHAVYDQKAKGLETAHRMCVVHANENWSEANWNRDNDAIQNELLSDFKRFYPEIRCSEVGLHRWRFSRPRATLTTDFARDERSNRGELIFVGDCFKEASLEGAFGSGVSAARYLVRQIQVQSVST